MPTPNLYNKLAYKILPYKRYILVITGIGLIICILSIIALVKVNFNTFPLFGLGCLIFIWGWGMFLVANWYGNESTLASRFPEFIRKGSEWFSSFFLDIFFIGGSIFTIQFIWRNLQWGITHGSTWRDYRWDFNVCFGAPQVTRKRSV